MLAKVGRIGPRRWNSLDNTNTRGVGMRKGDKRQKARPATRAAATRAAAQAAARAAAQAVAVAHVR